MTLEYKGICDEYELSVTKNTILEYYGTRPSQKKKGEFVRQFHVWLIHEVSGTVSMDHSTINKMSNWNFVGE